MALGKQEGSDVIFRTCFTIVFALLVIVTCPPVAQALAQESPGHRAVDNQSSTEQGSAGQLSTAQGSAGTTLTLEDCIVLAKENSPRLVQLSTSIQKSNVSVASARSSYYPSVDFSTSYRNSGGFGGERHGSYSTSLGLGYAIYQGGYRSAALEAARARVRVAEEQYRLSENQLTLQVKEAFYRILQKQEQISLVDDVVKRRKQDLILIELKYEAGRESSPAVKEAEANLLQAEYDRKRADEELVLAKLDLNLLLGRPGRTELSLVHEEEETQFPPVGTLVQEAKTRRPELRSERANTPVLEAQVKQARSNYLPRISFSSSYSLQGSELADQEDNWSMGISLSLPIFDGYSTKAKVTEARLSVENQRDVMRELELEIEEEVEQAYSTWELAKSIIEVAETSLEAARDMYQLTKLQYEQGMTSYFFLQQKESGLTQAENSHLNALLSLRLSAARLERACGRVS